MCALFSITVYLVSFIPIDASSAMKAYSAVLVCQQQILQIQQWSDGEDSGGMILIDCDRTNSSSVT